MRGRGAKNPTLQTTKGGAPSRDHSSVSYGSGILSSWNTVGKDKRNQRATRLGGCKLIYLLLASGAFLAVFILFRFLTFITRKTNPRGPADYADFIERYMESQDGAFEWDDFMTIAVEDSRLDSIRLRLANLGAGGPPFSQTTLQELREILSQLRSMQREAHGRIGPEDSARAAHPRKGAN